MSALYPKTVRVVIGPAGGQGVEIEGLKIKASVDRTKGSKPDKAKIEIYNLGDALARAVEDTSARNVIQLFAGFAGTAPRIFAGEIRKGRARTTTQGTDMITRIEAKDGGTAYRSARLTKSWGRGVRMSDVVAEVGRAFGVPISLPAGVADVSVTQGLTVNGPARETLDRLARSMGFEWGFEDGKIVTTTPGGDTGQEAPRLTYETGLISLERTDKGINAVALVSPRIRPRRIVSVRDGAQGVDGFYLVTKTKDDIDSREGPYFTAFEAREIRT